MAAPILQVPVGGPVAARPRREGLYDHEQFVQSGTTLTYPFFQNTRSFVDGGAVKTAGLDTNMLGSGGSIPRGHYLRVFGIQLYITRRGTARLTAAGNDDKRKILDAGWWRFSLGTTPYLDAPVYKIPAGCGIFGPLSTTESGLTAGDVQNGWPVPSNFFDLTVPGTVRVGGREVRVPRIPINLAETENFAVSINFPTRPTITTSDTLTLGMYLVSIYLKPLSG
jgi:hypothetical protein